MTTAKRAFDLAGAVLGLVVVAPLLVAIALLIRLFDGGPVLYRQSRVGRDGRLFRLWKFRSMTDGAERAGPPLTVGRDLRITRIGRWLRRSKLDELPQLVNVLRGEMSLVGPRPEVPRYVARYDAQQRRVLRLRPGITDPGSMCFPDEAEVLARAADPERAYVEQVMPEKLRVSLEYADRATLGTDLLVLFRTLRYCVRPRAPELPGERTERRGAARARWGRGPSERAAPLSSAASKAPPRRAPGEGAEDVPPTGVWRTAPMQAGVRPPSRNQDL